MNAYFFSKGKKQAFINIFNIGKLFFLILISALTLPSWASEFKTIAITAIARDAPSVRGKEIFILPKGMPVETFLSYGEWIKVRDATGDNFWVESKNTTPTRNIITIKSCKLYATPNTQSSLYAIDKGVLFEWLESSPSGWVKVKHQDGTTGYIRSNEVWGK